jgi:hypothetical protein
VPHSSGELTISTISSNDMFWIMYSILRIYIIVDIPDSVSIFCTCRRINNGFWETGSIHYPLRHPYMS